MEKDPEAPLDDLHLIREWVTHGVSLQFTSAPASVEYPNTPTVLRNADVVRSRLRQYIDFDAVIELPPEHPCPYGIQPLHVIIKPNKKPRLVIDLSRNLNQHLTYKYFSYSSVQEAAEASTVNCWYGKLDLSNCFLSFPLHPEAWPHFIFRFEEKLYQFRRMPFGLSTAPRICTLLLSVVAHRLTREQRLKLIRYLDDFLFITATQAEMERCLRSAQQVFSDFGLVINQEKTEGPSQRIVFLGILLDSVNQTLSCTTERLAEITTLLSTAIENPRITLSSLASLIGKLQFAASVLPGARPFLRRMLDLQHFHEARLRRKCPPLNDSSARRLHFTQQRSSVFTDRGFRADAAFWQGHLLQWNGTARWRSAQSDPVCFATDASLQGFGFYLESTPSSVDTSTWPQGMQVTAGFSGAYSPAHRHLHMHPSQMTWCEMFAIYAALFTYRNLLRHCYVLFYTDSQTDVHVLNRQATRSARLAGLLREIYTITLHCNISVYAQHRSGEDNILADFLSRPDLHGTTHIVRQWRSTHPSLSHMLSSVSVVHSAEFINSRLMPSSTSTSHSLSGPTPIRRTVHNNAHSSLCAPNSASTLLSHSPRTASVSSWPPSPLGVTKSPPSPDSSPQLATTP